MLSKLRFNRGFLCLAPPCIAAKTLSFKMLHLVTYRITQSTVIRFHCRPYFPSFLLLSALFFLLLACPSPACSASREKIQFPFDAISTTQRYNNSVTKGDKKKRTPSLYSRLFKISLTETYFLNKQKNIKRKTLAKN